MDELTRFEMSKKAYFADIAAEALADGAGKNRFEDNDVNIFMDVARNKAVRETGHIFAYDRYNSDAVNRLMKYVTKYGYEIVNEFVKSIIARMPAKEEVQE